MWQKMKNNFYNWDKVFKNEPSKICERHTLKNLKEYDLLKQHCVKSVQNRVISGPYFPVFGFNPNTGKYGPEITPYLGTFHAVQTILLQIF